MAELLIETPDGRTEVVPLGDRPVTAGRAEDCDVVLSEQRASRRHCVFEPTGDGYRVVDLESSNGTWLGERPVLASRLQPGDEVRIGETVITVRGPAQSVSASPSARAPRPRRRPLPLGTAAVCVLVAAAAVVAASVLRADRDAAEAAAWRRYAEAGVERARLPVNAPRRDRLLQDLRRDLAPRPRAEAGLAFVDAAIAAPAPTPSSGETREPAWRGALDDLASDTRRTHGQRAARLRDLLSRHGADAAAAAALREAIEREAAARAEDASTGGGRAREAAEEAARAGRLGEARERWLEWASATALTADEERAVAAELAALRERGRGEAQRVVADYERLVAEGRPEVAKSEVEAAVERLRGTGWDDHVAALTTARRASGAATAGPAPVAATDTTRARERVIRALHEAERTARERRFAAAADELLRLTADIGDEGLRREAELRAADLRREAAAVERLLEQVRVDPARFGTLKHGGRTLQVLGAGVEEIRVGPPRGAPESLPLATIEPELLDALFAKARLEPEETLSVALVMRDLGALDAYLAWIRRGLAAEATKGPASALHARMLGVNVPPGGYVPHPTDGRSVITFDDLRTLENAEKIAQQTAALAKVVEKIEGSKAAQQIARVREAYVELEAARKHALELIFDEQRYFYPYRDRPREYMPVQREVNDRVAKVVERWEGAASARPRADSSLEKLLTEAEDLRIEIEYLGGSEQCGDLVRRIEGVRRYLGRDLTVQNWFETDADLALLERNAAVMRENETRREVATDAERAQVRITNEYRIMMGHRPALLIHDKLVLAARGHSEDMAEHSFFDHFSPLEGKRTPADRMVLAGYPNVPCSENIAMGSSDPQSVHQRWCNSSGHHRNLLNSAWTEMGSGVSGGYWTQNFGASSDGGAPQGDGTPR